MSRSAFRPAVRTLASKRSGCWRMTLRAWVPMEPVEPRIAIFFFIVCFGWWGRCGCARRGRQRWCVCCCSSRLHQSFWQGEGDCSLCQGIVFYEIFMQRQHQFGAIGRLEIDEDVVGGVVDGVDGAEVAVACVVDLKSREGFP